MLTICPKIAGNARLTQIEIGPQLIEPQAEELQSIEPQSASPEHESLFDTSSSVSNHESSYLSVTDYIGYGS
jgi:hypothetical protein